MEWLAVVSTAVVSVACALPLSAPVPRVVAPSMKVTVPVGVPGVVDVTVAVKVTDCPTTEGLRPDVTVVVDGACPIVCERPGDVDPLKLASPAYTALMVWL